jgi:hypothetical protein
MARTSPTSGAAASLSARRSVARSPGGRRSNRTWWSAAVLPISASGSATSVTSMRTTRSTSAAQLSPRLAARRLPLPAPRRFVPLWRHADLPARRQNREALRHHESEPVQSARCWQFRGRGKTLTSSAMGQNAKGSSRAHVFWFSLNYGHCNRLRARCGMLLAPQVNSIARPIQCA